MKFCAIGIDPGGTTGWAAVWVDPIRLLNQRSILDGMEYDCGQFTGGMNTQASQIVALIEDIGANSAVVMEEFVPRKVHVDLAPVRIAEKVEYALWLLNGAKIQAHGCKWRYFKQMPALAMTTVTDERLREWGLWEVGKEHARDALRHSVTFLRRCQADRMLLASAFLGSENEVGHV